MGALKTNEEEQADAMARALDWLKNKESSGASDDPDFDFEKFDVGDFAPKSPEEKERELQDTLAWLRNSGSDIKESNKFQKVDLLLPKKEGQSLEDRAKEMQDALSWLRSKGLDLDDNDDDVESFDTLGIVPMGLRSMYERDRDVKNATDWIRHSSDLESDNAFSRLDDLIPARAGQTEQDRANDMANALAWLLQMELMFLTMMMACLLLPRLQLTRLFKDL